MQEFPEPSFCPFRCKVAVQSFLLGGNTSGAARPSSTLHPSEAPVSTYVSSTRRVVQRL